MTTPSGIGWRLAVRAASTVTLAALLAGAARTLSLTAVVAGAARAAEKPTGVPAAAASTVHTADEALARLIEGNDRFMDGETTHGSHPAPRRIEVAKAQMPFATILCCDDSRVPPEVVFDRGLGDLFVVRTAGHVVDDAVLGSLEFGARELHIPLLVVMGHERCSTVKTVRDLVTRGGQTPAEMARVVKSVRPAIVKTRHAKGDALDAAVRAHVELTVERLRKTPSLAGLVVQGRLKIVGARYDLDTGGVEVIVP